MKRLMSVVLIFVGLLLVDRCAAQSRDEALLVVTGQILRMNSPDKKTYSFSFADLNKLGNVRIRAENGYVSEAEFTGPLMKDILKKVGVKAGAKDAILTGLDDYVSRVPLTDFDQWRVIVAHSLNGRRMTVDNKGPLWVMYPLDDYPSELRNTVTASKLVWNLVSIEVR